MTTLAPEEIERIAARLTTPQDVLRWALERYHPQIAFAFSGAEDVVVIDLMHRIQPAARVFTLDTGRLPGETYELLERVRQRYGISIQTVFPQREAVEALVRAKGFYSFRQSLADRQECCAIRKVEPMRRALSGLKAWITGIRRDQSPTRADVRTVELDAAFGGIVKVNPLAYWDHAQVWDHIRAHKIPYNRLHDRNYPSIGCEPCTRAVGPGEDARSGRWWWENPEHKECGLHLNGRAPEPSS
jgi:phosphoadenosine phosphosulfate reductase